MLVVGSFFEPLDNDILSRDINFRHSIHVMIIDIIIIWEHIIDEAKLFFIVPSRTIYEWYTVICIHNI